MLGSLYRIISVFGWMAATFIILWSLAGCASPQDGAGMTVARVTWCPEPDGALRLCGAEIMDGKERRDVSLALRLPDGTAVVYQAADVRAFEAQALRAAVEKALIEEIGEAAPAVVEAVVAAVLKGGL